MRPLNSREKDLTGDASNLQQVGSSGLHLAVEDRDYDFKFDEVLGLDGTQEELFKRVLPQLFCSVLHIGIATHKCN